MRMFILPNDVHTVSEVNRNTSRGCCIQKSRQCCHQCHRNRHQRPRQCRQSQSHPCLCCLGHRLAEQRRSTTLANNCVLNYVNNSVFCNRVHVCVQYVACHLRIQFQVNSIKTKWKGALLCYRSVAIAKLAIDHGSTAHLAHFISALQRQLHTIGQSCAVVSIYGIRMWHSWQLSSFLISTLVRHYSSLFICKWMVSALTAGTRVYAVKHIVLHAQKRRVCRCLPFRPWCECICVGVFYAAHCLYA